MKIGVLVQYFQEENGDRRVLHFRLESDGDTSGTFYELYSEQGEPDSGSFSYFLNEDRTFIIDEDEDEIYGIIDDEGDVLSIVRSDSGFALYGVGIRKSSGNTLASLSGEYWLSEFSAQDNFEAVGLDYVDFDGEGTATVYRIENTVGELDTFDFEYSVEDEGAINFDAALDGILSPDGQVFVAGKSILDEGESTTYVIGIKKSSGLDNSALNGSYIYNIIETESDGSLDEESSIYARINFDGEGQGEVVMYLGEADSDSFEYNIDSDGYFEVDSSLGAVSADGRYFFNVEMDSDESVGFGFGIKSVDLSLSVENDPSIQQPSSFVLKQNYPNPFNPTTAIGYQLSTVSDVELSVYNLLGQQVAVLVSEGQSAGSYQVEWDASGFASGIYIYRLQSSSGFVQTRKLVLVK